MANQCVIFKPADFSEDVWQYGGAGSPYELYQIARSARPQTPFYFDADTYNIQCVAFGSSSGLDSIVGLGSSVMALQAQVAGQQAQISAIAPWTGASSSEAQQNYFSDVNALWYLFFGVAISIMCIRKLADFFDRSPHHE